MASGGGGAPAAAAVRRRTPPAEGPAAVLAIGVANPANCVSQDEFADYFFRITKSDHLTDLKDKLNRICQKSGIEKRFFHMNEEILDAHPELIDRESPSLQARVDITATEVADLAASAAARAVAEWGRPATDITHVVFSSYSGAGAPSADLRLASLLGLRPSVCRTALSLHGCAGGARALHLAKDIAENNRGARVLVACSEISLVAFCGPTEGCSDSILGPGLFGDGAGAVILGAGPITAAERPLFEVASAAQATISGTEHAITTRFAEGGLRYHVGKLVPELVERSIERCLLDVTGPLGIPAGGEWNDLFWAVHPGGRAILDRVEAALRLEPGKLAASRRVLSEYGNMTSATMAFVLDELRHRFWDKQDHAEWGVMVTFGPGMTLEVMVLHATSNLREV